MIHPEWVSFLEEEKNKNKEKVDYVLCYTTKYEEKDLHAIDSFLMSERSIIRKKEYVFDFVVAFGLHLATMIENKFPNTTWKTPNYFNLDDIPDLILIE